MRQKGGAALKLRVALAFGLLALVLCVGSVTQYRMEGLCNELCDLLRDESAGESFSKAKERWSDHITLLSVMIRHDRIDNITEAFARAEAFLQADTEDEFRAEKAQIVSKLIWLREYDRPSFRSIF